MQLPFTYAGCALLAFFVLAADRQLARIPVDPVPPQAFSSELVPVDLDPDAPPGWILSGAWQLRGHDITFRGLSGLAFDGDALVAVSDNGLMVRFFPFGRDGPSEAAVRMIDPDSPYQDAEALAVRGGAAFVAYEGTPILLRQGGQPAQRFALPGFARGNRGAEALFDTGSELFAIGEDGRQAAVFRDGRLAPRSIRGPVDAPTGAARWPGRRDGLLLQRGFGIGGFRASVSTLSITPGGDLVAGRPAYPLGLSWTDNAEGIAIRERTGGGHEVWIVTDDNARPPQRSLLVRYDVPEGGWPFGDGGVNRPVAPLSD